MSRYKKVAYTAHTLPSAALRVAPICHPAAANLCLSTTRTCPGFAENWAFHTMLASSMWRLINMRPINF